MEIMDGTLYSKNSLKKGYMRYINKALGLSCFSDMQKLRVFPNGKEITESFAAFHAAKHFVPFFDFKDESIDVICVGDGRTPRTASVFAFMTKNNIYSIDPNLKKADYFEQNIQRLKCLRSRVEDINFESEKVIIVAVHSHASLKNTLEHIKGDQRALIAIPCCISYNHSKKPDYEYKDPGIWSPKNVVKVWKEI